MSTVQLFTAVAVLDLIWQVTLCNYIWDGSSSRCRS